MPTVLVLGKSGQLARELARATWPGGTVVQCCGRDGIDIADSAALHALVARIAPKIVVNTAAYTAVDKAESEPAAAFRTNRDGVAAVAEACAAARIPLMHVSTDYVFDGETAGPYGESAPTGPLSLYGQSKLAGEEALRRCHGAHVILRTAGVFSPFGSNIVRSVLERAAAGQPLAGLADRWFCPTSARDLARAVVAMVTRLFGGGGPVSWGTYHFCGQPATTILDFIDEIVDRGADAGLTLRRKVAAASIAEWREAAPRPRNAVLDCGKIAAVWGIAPRPWRAELAACIAEIAAQRAGASGQAA